MLITFDQALARCSADVRPSLLLGNGFSRGWRDEIFNYSSLLQRADFGEGGDHTRALFARLETYDFEAVMRALQSTAIVLEAYGELGTLRERIDRDGRALKDALITAISVSHPGAPQEVSRDHVRAVRGFLHKFGRIFTVNYDLLFYWARNAAEIEPVGVRTDDGFRGPVWKGYDTNQEAFFLHGGLHLYESGSRVLKHVFADSGVRIIDLVRRNLDRGRFPLFVSEPTSKKKLERIEHNPYLSFCYRALSDLGEDFFVLGHSLDENDKHIFDRIQASNVQRVFVGIHGDPQNEGNTRTRANALAFFECAGREIGFFDSETACVWAPR